MQPLRLLVLCATLTGIAACGNRGHPVPLQEARHQEPRFRIAGEEPAPAAVAVPPEGITLMERHFVAGGRMHQLSRTMLRQIAASGGTGVYALTWDEPPYDRLFVQADAGSWREVVPVHD